MGDYKALRDGLADVFIEIESLRAQLAEKDKEIEGLKDEHEKLRLAAKREYDIYDGQVGLIAQCKEAISECSACVMSCDFEEILCDGDLAAALKQRCPSVFDTVSAIKEGE